MQFLPISLLYLSLGFLRLESDLRLTVAVDLSLLSSMTKALRVTKVHPLCLASQPRLEVKVVKI